MKLEILGANRAEVELNNDVRVLFSYSTCVAAIINGQSYRTAYPWSRTTSGHINKWLRKGPSGTKPTLTKPQEFFNDLADGLTIKEA